MGLDMYVFRKRKGEKKEQEVAYWRKANQIFHWFENNVAINNTIEDCEGIPVTLDDLDKLKIACKDILINCNNENYAKKNMPTRDGFFFGGTSYDEYYFYDLENTIRYIDDILSTHQDNDTYTFLAWW